MATGLTSLGSQGLTLGLGPKLRVTLAKGLFAMCNISFTWRLLALLTSAACLAFHATTHAAKNRKKQEKNTEKNTNKSICN